MLVRKPRLVRKTVPKDEPDLWLILVFNFDVPENNINYCKPLSVPLTEVEVRECYKGWRTGNVLNFPKERLKVVPYYPDDYYPNVSIEKETHIMLNKWG